jgi:predicted SAM-dependent methyltransferase
MKQAIMRIPVLGAIARGAWRKFRAVRGEHQLKRLSRTRPIKIMVGSSGVKQDGMLAARYCYQFLKPGGYLRLAVPDGFHPDDAYIRSVEPGGTGAGATDHKVLYNHETLTNMLQTIGFDVQLLEYFDSNGEFHCNEWGPEEGMIRRSIRFDKRNENGSPTYTSLIVDCRKAT